MQPDFLHENLYESFCVLGMDEAGRGPLAGPVVAACALVDKNCDLTKINDSKKLSKTNRKKIFLELKKNTKFGVGVVDCKTIDEINIFNATKLAMLKAYQDFCEKYKIFPEVILVDGNFIPFEKRDKLVEIKSIIKGDEKSISIAAASIIAKETRDELMIEIHKEYPQFGFDKHMGYPTKFHVEQIKLFDICKFHRKSFEPIKSMVNPT